MDHNTACPICRYKLIVADNKRCPQCESDLVSFHLLSDLAKKETEIKKPGFNLPFPAYAVIVLVLINSVLIGLVINQKYATKSAMDLLFDGQRKITTIINTQIKLLNDLKSSVQLSIQNDYKAENNRSFSQKELKILNELIDKRFSEKAPVHSKNEEHFIGYRVLKNDTLWTLAERFYESGWLYPVLLEHNPHLGTSFLRVNSRIAVLSNPRQAVVIYKKIIHKVDGQLYWYYTVRERDSLSSIAKKFFGSKNAVDKLKKLNPNAEFLQGEKIKVKLY
jgi:hypothetical protein